MKVTFREMEDVLKCDLRWKEIKLSQPLKERLTFMQVLHGEWDNHPGAAEVSWRRRASAHSTRISINRGMDKEDVVTVKPLSHVWLFATPRTVAYQASLSMGFSRQEYWSGLPFPSPGDLPNPGIECRSPALQADVLPSEPQGMTGRYG